NLMELLYAQSGTPNNICYYGRYNGEFWEGSEFSISTSYPILGLDMDASNIYIASDQRGLLVYSRATQQMVSQLAFPGYAEKLITNDGIVYVAARHGGLQIVDVSNPAQPNLLGNYNTTGYASDIDYQDGKVAVSSGSGGVYLFDVSAPANPKLLSRITDCGYANTVTFMGDRLAVASRDYGIMIYSLD
ncbi:MAG TPA: hypothetical protein PLX77_04695, partial [Candidatus Cloacimonadota bacterium]|nr:hypothetical protein [Candidatus Cloacimonadota bacterium]